MQKKSFRIERINDLFQQNLAEILYREVSDPQLQKVTISGVEVSRDLAHAKIYFVVPEDCDLNEVLKGFARAKGFLRTNLAKRCDLRVMPDLHFHYDPSFKEGSHIDALIQKALRTK